MNNGDNIYYCFYGKWCPDLLAFLFSPHSFSFFLVLIRGALLYLPVFTIVQRGRNQKTKILLYLASAASTADGNLFFFLSSPSSSSFFFMLWQSSLESAAHVMLLRNRKTDAQFRLSARAGRYPLLHCWHMEAITFTPYIYAINIYIYIYIDVLQLGRCIHSAPYYIPIRMHTRYKLYSDVYLLWSSSKQQGRTHRRGRNLKIFFVCPSLLFPYFCIHYNVHAHTRTQFISIYMKKKQEKLIVIVRNGGRQRKRKDKSDLEKFSALGAGCFHVYEASFGKTPSTHRGQSFLCYSV